MNKVQRALEEWAIYIAPNVWKLQYDGDRLLGQEYDYDCLGRLWETGVAFTAYNSGIFAQFCDFKRMGEIWLPGNATISASIAVWLVSH